MNDKFSKIRPVLIQLNEKFIKHAALQENHSIDESMFTYFVIWFNMVRSNLLGENQLDGGRYFGWLQTKNVI